MGRVDAGPGEHGGEQHHPRGGKKKPEDRLIEPDERICLPDADYELVRARAVRTGRRGGDRVVSRHGRSRRARAARPGEALVDLALDATLRAAALRAARGGGPALPTRRCDVRLKERVRLRKNLVVFAVDASDSMAVDARMAAAKGAALAVLRSAYQRRDRVAMVVFEGDEARVVLQPTASTSLAQQQTRLLPTGGATPLAHGLMLAWKVVAVEQLRDPSVRPRLVLLTDGGANVTMSRGADVWAEIGAIAEGLRRAKVDAVVVDTGHSEQLEWLGARLGAPVRRLGRFGAASLIEAFGG